MAALQHDIVIIGAGTGGITVAAQLLKKDKSLDIAIVDPAEKHYYQPAWTLVGAGTYKYKKTERSMASLIPKGAQWIQESVTEINPEEKKIHTREGTELSYNYLVLSPGVKYDLPLIEGLEETLGKNNVCSNYTDPEYTWEVLQNFKGGNALFTQPATPIKCGGAPQKIMYLADDYFQKTGTKSKTNVMFATPGSVIFGVKEFADTLMDVVNRKDITLKFFHELYKIDGPAQKAYYKITVTKDEGKKLEHNPNPDIHEEYVGEQEVIIPFAMLHLAPPQTAPDFIANSKVAHQEGPNKGWINVDKHTLQHNEYPTVFALGDAAALPTAKTGAAIRKQAPVVVENLMKVKEADKNLVPGYEGYSSCPLVTGYGKMVLAEFKYDNVRDSDPTISKFVDTTKESWLMWLLKKYGLPYMYWNMMLKGNA